MPNLNLLVEQPYDKGRYAAFFEQTDGTELETPPGGYLYISDREKGGGIIDALQINGMPLPFTANDIKILWSNDGRKCGIAIWGRMRGIINVASGEQVRTELKGRESQAVFDSEWLSGFDNYLDELVFMRVRQRFWKTEADYRDPNRKSRPESETPIETNFIAYEKGPDHLFAVFEDDGRTGYFYLYDARQQEIVEQVHNYDRSKKLPIELVDVRLVWSRDGQKCAVIIWDKIRGIIDRTKTRPGRVWMEDKYSPGITDNEWLSGFE